MNVRDIRIRGVGAVSSAGWSAAAMHQAVLAGTPLPSAPVIRPGDVRTWPCESRFAPASPPEKIARHPRLRRSSSITRYSVAAALEALADAGHDPAAPPSGLGILFVMMNGCVNYTGRFFHEVLQNPAQASPLIFPETVFNAPASHVASFLGVDGAVSTLLGSPNSIMEALDTAAFWISSGLVGECLLIAAEECDWLSAEGLTYYHPKLTASEGAGALLLSASGNGPRFSEVVGPLGYLSWQERCDLLPDLAAQTLAQFHGPATLINDRTGIPKLDHAEIAAWSGRSWDTVLSPKYVLGESMGASSALQLVLGTLAARQTQQPVVISMPGTNTAAYSCVLTP
jgi:3-oxoacyl-[acyl-carrier-protein] synthase II